MKKLVELKIIKFIKKIFPHNRSLTGDGNRKTLFEIKKILKNLKSYPIQIRRQSI